LQAVGEDWGGWNWTLVGPDPQRLPLSAGGQGSFDELRACVARRRNHGSDLYGLLRLNFGPRRGGRQKHVFLHIRLRDQLANEQASETVRAMEKALSAFANLDVKVEARDAEDLKLEAIVERLRQASPADATMLTVKAHREALAELAVDVYARAAAEQIFREQCAPAAEEAERFLESDEPVPDERSMIAESSSITGMPSTTSCQDGPSPQRARPSYRKGDLVAIYSRAARQWVDDGVIHDEVQEKCCYDGCKLVGGSVKVLYNNKTTFKWVLPEQFRTMLKPSSRPAAPYSLVGQLLKQTHNWIATWHVRHFELNNGHLQWWMTPEDAKAGRSPRTSLCLMDVQVNARGSIVYLHTGGPKVVAYAFDATSEESAELWFAALEDHATYCAAMAAYLSMKATQDRQGRDRLGQLVGERKRAISSSRCAL